MVSIRNGAVDEKVLRKVRMTEEDVWQDPRTEGTSHLEHAAEARMERSGPLSVVEIAAPDDVQKVRVGIPAGPCAADAAA
jgi:uncharacterized membrane protein YcaP (DUF421 family)